MARYKTKFTGIFYRDSITNDKQDKTYYIVFKDNDGKMREVKIGKHSEGVRENYCNQKRNEILTKQRLGEEPPAATRNKKRKVVSIQELAAEYFKTRKEGRGKHSDLITFNKHLADYFTDMEIASKKDIEKFISLMEQKTNQRGEPISEKTINNVLTILTAIVRFSIKEELLKNDITPWIKKYQIDNTRERFLSKQEVKLLFERIEEQQDKELKLFTKLALGTGARVTSIMSIKKTDIDFTHNTITLKDYKNNSSYKGFLTQELNELLLEQTKKLKPSEPIFSTAQYTLSSRLSKILNQLFNQAIAPSDRKNRVVVHTLRHTFASHLAMAGTPIYTLQKLMNHKEIKMTLRYAKLSPDNGRDYVETLWS